MQLEEDTIEFTLVQICDNSNVSLPNLLDQVGVSLCVCVSESELESENGR